MTTNNKGEVTQVTVEASSGHRRLDGALRYAMTPCRFQPALDDAGVAVTGVTSIRHVWRLEDAMPDPWVALRTAAIEARWTPTENLGTVAFTSPSAATLDERLKVLRRLQDAARENAGCASIERVSPAPMPAAWSVPSVVKSASGRPVRIVSELWNTTQCDVGMTYGLILRFPEDEPAHFVMTPFPPESDAARAASPPTASYAQRIAAVVRPHIAYVGGKRNPVAEVELKLSSDGRITGTRLTQRSSDPMWDDAVLAGIAKASRLPRDSDGRVPPVVILSLRPR